MRRITIGSARTWPWIKTRRWVGQSSGPAHCRHPNLVRLAPPLRPDMIFGKDTFECLSLAECMNDPERRAEILRYARWCWGSVDGATGIDGGPFKTHGSKEALRDEHYR